MLNMPAVEVPFISTALMIEVYLTDIGVPPELYARLSVPLSVPNVFAGEPIRALHSTTNHRT